MPTTKRFVYKSHFDGMPKETDLQLVEEKLPELQAGEFLVEAVYLGIDPSMRLMAPDLALGQTFHGPQVAKVIDSKNRQFPVGKHVVGEFGWRTHTIATDLLDPVEFYSPWLIPDPEGLPLSLFLGVLGMPGLTAYFGFHEILKPKSGETLVVTCSPGSHVGSIAGQFGKMNGNRVIAVGSQERKRKWLLENLKFDHFINYADKEFDKKLEAAAPHGIDCYFDTEGGQISTKIINKMNTFGRIAVSGAGCRLSGNDTDVDAVQFDMISKQLSMEGFMARRWRHKWVEAIEQNKMMVKNGQLKYLETVVQSFGNTFKAFVDMLEEKNLGTTVVKV